MTTDKDWQWYLQFLVRDFMDKHIAANIEQLPNIERSYKLACAVADYCAVPKGHAHTPPMDVDELYRRLGLHEGNIDFEEKDYD